MFFLLCEIHWELLRSVESLQCSWVGERGAVACFGLFSNLNAMDQFRSLVNDVQALLQGHFRYS